MQVNASQFEPGTIVQIDYVTQGMKMSGQEAIERDYPCATLQGPYPSRRAVLVEAASSEKLLAFCYKGQGMRTFLLSRIVGVVHVAQGAPSQPAARPEQPAPTAPAIMTQVAAIQALERNYQALKEQIARGLPPRTVVNSGVAELRQTLDFIERQYVAAEHFAAKGA